MVTVHAIECTHGSLQTSRKSRFKEDVLVPGGLCTSSVIIELVFRKVVGSTPAKKDLPLKKYQLFKVNIIWSSEVHFRNVKREQKECR